MIRLRLSLTCDRCRSNRVFEHDLQSLIANPSQPQLPRGWGLSGNGKEHICKKCVETGADQLADMMLAAMRTVVKKKRPLKKTTAKKKTTRRSRR